MDGGVAFGAGKAGQPFDPIGFLTRPQVILRFFCWVRFFIYAQKLMTHCKINNCHLNRHLISIDEIYCYSCSSCFIYKHDFSILIHFGFAIFLLFILLIDIDQ